MVVLEFVVLPGKYLGKSPTPCVLGLDVRVVEAHEERLFASVRGHGGGFTV